MHTDKLTPTTSDLLTSDRQVHIDKLTVYIVRPVHTGKFTVIVRPVHTDKLTLIVRLLDTDRLTVYNVRPVHTDRLTVYNARPVYTDKLTAYNVRPVHTDKLTAYIVRPVHREKTLGALCSDRTKMNSDDSHHSTKRRPVTDPVTPLTGGALCSHRVLIPNTDGPQ